MRATEPRPLGRIAACLLGLAAGAAGAVDAPEPPALVLSADGSEVLNLKAGIAWARCVEGMTWSGQGCVGVPLALEHGRAMTAAGERRKAEGKAWRLPRAPELQRLASQLSRMRTQAPRLFPDGAEASWHWSSSTTLDTSRVNAYDYGNVRRGVTNDNVARVSFLHGWAVNLASGQADGGVTKRTPLHVRLVRTLKP